MEKMDTLDTLSTEPVTLQMWKIVHSPIVSMYRNLGDSCDNWENYISFIINSSMDIYDIFIPRTNSNSTTKQNEIIEQKYFNFASWFQGRIFYILSCDKLKSVHGLSVELQLKILDTLHLHQPNYYQKLSLEYVSSLETILRNSYNKDQTLYTGTYIIEQFSVDNNLNIDSLELHPVYIEISSDTKPKSLVGYLITILSHILSLEVQVCLKNKLFMSTWKCFMLIIESCEIQQKLEVISSITMIIKKMGLHTVYDNSVKEYFINFFSVLDSFISVSLNLVTTLETKRFFSVFNNLLEVVIRFNATKDTEINVKLFKMCQYFICDEMKNKLSTEQTMFTNSSTNDLTDLSCELIKIILLQTPELHLDVQKWLSDIKFMNFSSILKIMQILIKYEIVNNLNTNFPKCNVTYIDVGKTSTTWNRLCNILELYTNNSVKVTTENLKVVLEILTIARIIDIELNKCLYSKPHKFIFIYFKSDSKIIPNIIDLIKTNKITGSEETLHILMVIVEIFGCILRLQDFSKRNEIITEEQKPTADSYREMQIMIGIISVPFLKSFNWSNSDPNVSQAVKSLICCDQIYNIEIRKKCLQTLLMSSLYCSNFDVKNNDIVEWVNRVFQNGVKTNKDILLDIILCCPNLIFNNIASAQTVLNTFLYPFLKSDDALVLQTVAKTLQQMICILGGNYFVTENYDTDNKSFYTKVICRDCDIVKGGEEFYYKENKNITINLCQFIKKQNIFERKESILEPFMKLFDKDNNNLRINMVNLLPYLAKHMPRFYTLEITKKWIQFISSPDLIVRKKMSNIIGNIIVNIQENLSHDDQLKNDILQLVVQNIINTAKKSLNTTDFELQETMLHITKEIGCLNIASQNINILCLKLLVHYIMNPQSTVSSFASSHFSDVAESLNMTSNDIYIQYKKDICRTMADNVVYNYEVYSIDFATSLQKISITLGFSGSRDFVNIDHHHILPYLIPWFLKAPVTKPLLNEIAELLTVEPSELLINNFCNIYPYVYLYETTEIYTECMNFIENITKQNISSLKKKNFKVIFNELLLHYYCKQQRVLEGLRELLKEDLEIYNDDLDDVNKIADLLQPRFQGVLVYFDIKLVSKKVAICIKRKALESLPEIIKLMGPKHVTPLRYKVIATLRTTLILNDGVFPQLNCLAWSAFIKCCDIELLGPLLSTIFVSLLPQFNKCPQIINDIFKYLIVDNEKKIDNYIQDLFFVSETNISNEIKVIVEKNMKKKCNGGLKNQLKFFLKYINHDSIEVRVFGVKFLTRLLLKNRQALNDIILGNNGLDSIIVELLDMLTMGCREGDESLQIACSECIGELGAIEPSHLPRRCIQTSETFIFYISDENFVINALYELTRAFQAEKHSQNMNCFALAIQEILKTYSVSPDSTSDDGRALWNNLPENQRQIMAPLLSSRYTIAVDSQPSVHLLFGSNAIASFTDWINSWTSNLIFFIQNPEKKCLFQQCLPSLKRDVRTLMFFLPHIIVHALLESSDSSRQHIYEEMIAVLSCFENKKNSNAVKTDWKPLKPDMSRHIPDMRPPEEAIQIKSSKVIYMLLDFLARWLREWQHSYCPVKTTGQDADYGIISDFIGRFCKLKVAESNYRCDEFPRALMYLEDYVDGNQDGFKEHLGFFARIYAELDEPDGVAGIRAIQQTEPSLEELILAHEVSGQLQDAATCYERMAQQQCSSPYFFQGMVRCYLDLDNPSTACRIAEGVIRSNPEYSPLMFESEAEPLWRLGQYNELAKLLARPELNDNTTWGVRIGRILLHFRNGERNQFHNELECTRKGLVSLLGAASLEEGAYQHGYPQIMKLHILNELQKTEEMVYRVKEIADKQLCDQAISELFNEWDLRYRLVHSSVRVVEPMLCLRRITLQQAKNLLSSHTGNVVDLIGKQIGRLWLKSARVARGACMYQQAYTYLLNAEQYKLKDLFVEKAKLHWKRGEQEVAFNTLKRGIEEYFPNSSIFKTLASNERIEDRKLCAEAKLLIAKYNDATVNVDIEVNLLNFKEAIEVYREWETSLVKLAQYYDKILSTMPEEDRDRNIGGDIQVHIINYFGKSLLFGSRFIYQSMPRILSIWLDFGTKLRNAKLDADVENRRNTLLRMTKLIDTFLERLPSYMFLSAFSQIISRICHPQVEVQLKLKSIIVTLIIKYPQQSLWMMMAVCKSSYSIRMKRCQEILQDHRIKSAPGLTKLIKDFMHLAEKLIELCNKGISEGVSKTSVTALVRALPRLLSTTDFSQIMLPVQKFRKMVLPNETHSLANHDPFPKRMVYIIGICDEVDILPSLQRPRKITLRGSDGKKYIQMLKPKDDLRKDFRLMEFNDVVNQYLYMEPESRQRRLYIRTYSVVPLNEECGLIEWVPNLVGLRPILINLYKQKGLFTTNKEMRTLMCNVRDTLQKKKKMYEEELLPRHPPVFSEWFRYKFPDPYSWYQARTAYIRTTAVMSMVGYILGLGDRHGENILFDSTNGDTVHVDFNCLFNKGETFDWPERVPFRLTHNMVKAMGPLGVEGMYRKSCEITLRVLRMQKDTLMSIVRPFVYDPLVSWPRNQLGRGDAANAERTNEQAVENIRSIELRLQGMKNRASTFSLSLSVEGQTNNLITEATSVENLCQMYIGWGPFL